MTAWAGFTIFYRDGSRVRSSECTWDRAPVEDVQFVHWIRHERGKRYRFVAAGYEDGLYRPMPGFGTQIKRGTWMTDEAFDRLRRTTLDDWEY